MRMVPESEFALTLASHLSMSAFDIFGCVTGPGRSGAVAAVYASHFLHIPFIPFGSKPPVHLGPLLIIDTAEQTGKTLRKALHKYEGYETMAYSLYKEPPRVQFWYEACNPKPQHYKHEIK